MTAWSLPRESKELVGPITVTKDDVAYPTFQIAVAAYGSRPVTFTDPTTVDNLQYRLTGPSTTDLAPGRYILWAKVTDTPEIPVIEVDTIHIT